MRFSNLVSSKISPRWIISDHLDTLVDGRHKRHWADYFTFFVVPLLIAVGAKWLGAELDYDMVSVINTGLALFAGLFLSVSIQLISIDKERLKSGSAELVRSQTVANISFLILLSLVAIVLSYFSLFKGIAANWAFVPYSWFKYAIDILVYWILGVFFFTVLMVLKRTSILFEHISG